MRCPIWGHVFGSKKSKKSDPQSHSTRKQDFQKLSFCRQNRNGIVWVAPSNSRLGKRELFDNYVHFYTKMLNFEIRARVKNQFWRRISPFFWSQKTPQNMLISSPLPDIRKMTRLRNCKLFDGSGWNVGEMYHLYYPDCVIWYMAYYQIVLLPYFLDYFYNHSIKVRTYA